MEYWSDGVVDCHFSLVLRATDYRKRSAQRLDPRKPNCSGFLQIQLSVHHSNTPSLQVSLLLNSYNS
jgi:hypothetical protein